MGGRMKSTRRLSPSWRRFAPAAGGLVLILAAAAVPLASDAVAARPYVYAITNAKILTEPGKILDRGTLVMRDGLIEAVGEDVKAPPDAVVIDGTGKTVHAGFIDGCSELASGGSGKGPGGPPRGEATGGSPPGARKPEKGAFHPISRIRPEHRMMDRLVPDADEMAGYRAMGFTSALVVPEEGIFRGTSVLVTTGDGAVPGLIVRSDVAQNVAFERGRFGQGYPTSLMGAIAAVRQGLEDARRHRIWQARYDQDPSGLKRPDSVSAWAPLARVASGEMPVIFDMESPANVLRALAVGKEYGLRAMVIGSGLEYEIAGDLARAGVPVILPLHYPDKPKMEDKGATLDVDTRDLRRYLDARTSAAALERAGVAFALGTCHMKKPTEFTANLTKALDAGLEPEAALAALTTAPARIFGVDRSLGRLAPGMAADLVVRDKDPFVDGSKVERVFVDGVEYPVKDKKPGDGGKREGRKGRRPEGGEGGAR
jgi:hypothetical protein